MRVPSRLTVPSFEPLQFAGQLPHLQQRCGDGLLVVAPEGAEGVRMRMGVAGQVAHPNVSIGGPLDAPGAEDAVGLAVNQQR